MERVIELLEGSERERKRWSASSVIHLNNMCVIFVRLWKRASIVWHSVALESPHPPTNGSTNSVKNYVL